MSQIAEKKFPSTMLLGGLSVNLNHLKTKSFLDVNVVNIDNQKYICTSAMVI